ncbi:MAG: VIT domain-containing protein [Verrucomicrobiota bacterium]|nr:VIT domain-containing protein [Verrucomicrobiota bacterium]
MKTRNETKQRMGMTTKEKNIKNLIVGVFALCLMSVSSFAAGTLTPLNSGLKPVEIESHHVKLTINNGFAITEVTQRFFNQNPSIVEAVYSFPLPVSASLSEVVIHIGERVINGEVVGKNEAKKVYSEEKKNGNNVGMAEKNKYKNFTFTIANIKPKESLIIKFVYYQPLKLNGDIGRYAYPLEEGHTDELAKNFWERNDKVASNITVDINLKSGWPLSSIRVPGVIPLKEEKKLDSGEYKASYELSTSLNKDFVLYYRLKADMPGRLEVIPYRKPGSKEGTFMMIVTPGLDLKPIKNGADYVFILDVSGSMRGEKIRTLCDGISRVLGKMKAEDRFKIVTFESSACNLTRGWINASSKNVNRWIEKVKKIKTGGSTNLYAGMSEGLSDLDADRTTSLVLVTDAVTNTGVVKPRKFYKMLKKYDIRVFGLIIGNSGNWPLMRLICDVSGGFYAGVSNSDDIIGQVMLAKQKITHESLHNAEIKIRGIKTYDLTGATLKKIYCGQQFVVFGRYSGEGKAKITLEASLSGVDKVYSKTVEFPQTDILNPELERLWAIERIKMFEDLENIGMMPLTETQSAIKDLGIRCQLVTDETSMIILDDETFKKHGIMRKNKARLSAEHKAQSKRLNKNRRFQNYVAQGSSAKQDTKRKRNKKMFKGNIPNLSGGGAIDPFTAFLMIVGSFGLFVLNRKRK